jgi:hypothetical protein
MLFNQNKMRIKIVHERIEPKKSSTAIEHKKAMRHFAWWFCD